MNNDYSYDTRPVRIKHEASATKIGKANTALDFNPWLFAIALVIATPLCVSFGLMILTAAGLVTL